MGKSNQLDPVTVEVIRTHYISTAKQMRNVLTSTSFSPIIYEMIDFSLGVYNKRAELIAEGPGMPLFLGAVGFAIKSIVDYLGEDNLEEGDIILSTYPYWTGSHPQDALVIQPIFIDGGVFGYSAVKAHWLDLGAKDIYGIDTTDVWQEGLQLLGVKIVKRGKLDNELVEILKANSRLPVVLVGDLTAQISACNRGVDRVTELVRKYGSDVVERATDAILDHGEDLARKAIALMPDGEWSAEGQMDNDGISDAPVKLVATVRISGDRLFIDATGTAAQTMGPVNCPLASTASISRLVAKMIISPEHDANEGFFRPIDLTVPEGTVLNPSHPAPVFLYGWAAIIFGEVLFKVMADVAPERAVARSGGDISAMLTSGFHPADGAYFAGGSDEASGQGASMDQDGENALISYALGEFRNVPVEILEERYPLLVERYELLPDSGGPGRFRGGLGVRKIWKALGEQNIITVLDQTAQPAWGVDGGFGTSVNRLILNQGSSPQRDIGKASGITITTGDSLDLRTAGGGGWGDPKDRDVRSVLDDVIAGYVSIESAESDYAVAVRDDGSRRYAVDEQKTALLRN